MKYRVLAGQSLADVALRVYGSAEGAIVLAKVNRIDITNTLRAGMELEVPEDAQGVKGIVEYYKNHRICPATDVGSEPDISLRVFTEEFMKEFK